MSPQACSLALALLLVVACVSGEGPANPDTGNAANDASICADGDIDAQIYDSTAPPMDALILDVNLPPDAGALDADDDDATAADASSPVTLLQTREGGGFERLKVAGNAAGNVVAVWQQTDVSQVERLWSTYYSPLGGWSEPAALESHTTSAYIKELAIDAAGNAMAVWQELEAGYDRSWASRYQVGSGWSEPARVDDPFSGTFLVSARPSGLTLFASGDALVVGLAGPVMNPFGWSTRYSPDGGWEPATSLLGGGPHLPEPDVGSDGRASALAAWCEASPQTTRPPPPNLTGLSYNLATGWSTDALPRVSLLGCAAPRVAPVAEDHFLVLYNDFTGSEPRLFVAVYRDGSWRSNTPLEETELRDGRLAVPEVGADSLGVTTVAWTASDGIWSKVYTPDGTLSPLALLSNGTGSEPYILTAFVVNAAGDALLVWSRGVDTGTLFARQRLGGIWSDATPPVMQTSGVFRVAIDSNAHVTSLWTTLDGSTSKLWATRSQLPW